MINFASGQILFRLTGVVTPFLVLLIIGDVEYATFELYLAVAGIIAPLILLGSDVAFTYYTASDESAKGNETIWIPIYVALCQSVIVFVILQLIGVSNVSVPILMLYVFSQSSFLTSLKIFRVYRKDREYLRQAKLSVLATFLQYVVLYFSSDILLFLFLRALVYIAQTYDVLRRSNAIIWARFGSSHFLKYLSYGAPLVPYAFFYGSFVGLDKILFGDQLKDLSKIAFASRIGQTLLIYFVIFRMWFNPIYFRMCRKVEFHSEATLSLRIFETISLIGFCGLYFLISNIYPMMDRLHDFMTYELLGLYLISYFIIGIFSVRIVVYNANETNMYASIPILIAILCYYLLFINGNEPQLCMFCSACMLLICDALVSCYVNNVLNELMEKLYIFPSVLFLYLDLPLCSLVLSLSILLMKYRHKLETFLEIVSDRSKV